MFEYLESEAEKIVDYINDTADKMDTDAKTALTQAEADETEAEQDIAEAASEESSCPHYKEVRRKEKDEDGKNHTVIEEVADLAADAASRARAAALRAQAKALQASASALRALARALSTQFDAMKKQKQVFSNAIADVNKQINDTTNKLNIGTGLMQRVIQSFSVPIINGTTNMAKNTINSILGDIPINLLDGVNKNDITGWVAKNAVNTGAVVAKSFVSTTINSMLGNGTLGVAGSIVAKNLVEPVMDEAFGEKSVDGVHTFLTSALGFLGVKDKQGEKENATAGTEEVNEILSGDNADIKVNQINNMGNGNNQDTLLNGDNSTEKQTNERTKLETKLNSEILKHTKLKEQADIANKEYLAAVNKATPYQNKMHLAEKNYKDAQVDYEVWQTAQNNNLEDYKAKLAKYGEKSYLTIEARKKYDESVNKAVPYEQKMNDAEINYKNTKTDYEVWQTTANKKWEESVEANKKVSTSEKNIKSLEGQISNLNNKGGKK